MSNAELQDKRTRGWLWIDNATLKHIGSEVGSYGIAVYAAIAMHTSGNGREAYPKAATIASIAGCSVRKVKGTIQELEGAGVLKVERRSGTSNLYTLVDAPVSSTEADSGGGVHDMHGGRARHARGGVHDMHANNNQGTRPKEEGGPPADSASTASSSDAHEPADADGDDVEVEPLLNAFRRAGAILTEKRSRILRRWAQQGFIDNVALFAEVVEEDVIDTKTKGCKLSMRILKDRYIERVQSNAERATRYNGKCGGGTESESSSAMNGAVTYEAAGHIIDLVRRSHNEKATLSEHFERNDEGRWKPKTPTAESYLASYKQDHTSQ